MKNLKPYNHDCFAVHKSAVSRKDEGELKKRLLNLDAEVEKEYKNFDAMFALNQIETLTSSSTLQASKDDLLTLYNYQSVVIRKVRENIRSQQIQTITSTCQNCTIDSINSLDHILPKSKYPEFVVNPKNLFPCCATCNSKKINSDGKSGGKQFLNLYLDQLPNVQYLFVKITIDKKGDFDFNFYLNNVGGQVDKKVFALIQNHYTRLDLFNRMKFKSIEYLSEFQNKLSSFKNLLPINQIQQSVSQSIASDQNVYGINYWRCILEMELIYNPLFISMI